MDSSAGRVVLMMMRMVLVIKILFLAVFELHVIFMSLIRQLVSKLLEIY